MYQVAIMTLHDFSVHRLEPNMVGTYKLRPPVMGPARYCNGHLSPKPTSDDTWRGQSTVLYSATNDHVAHSDAHRGRAVPSFVFSAAVRVSMLTMVA